MNPLEAETASKSRNELNTVEDEKTLEDRGDGQDEATDDEAGLCPKFTESKPVITPNDFRIRIAIDFDTDGIAIAYATNLNNVFVHTDR